MKYAIATTGVANSYEGFVYGISIEVFDLKNERVRDEFPEYMRYVGSELRSR